MSNSAPQTKPRITALLDIRDRQNTLKMYSGASHWPLEFRVSDRIDLDDIVRGMSHQNRFAGHTSIPINVCWHSLCLSYQVPKHLQGEALVHDITEALIMDIPSPLKNHPAFAFFKPAEDKLFSAMAQSLGLPFVKLSEELREYDVRIGNAEMSVYNPKGFVVAIAERNFSKEEVREIGKMARATAKLVDRKIVPEPTRIVATRKAWLHRYNDLFS